MWPCFCNGTQLTAAQATGKCVYQSLLRWLFACCLLLLLAASSGIYAH